MGHCSRKGEDLRFQRMNGEFEYEYDVGNGPKERGAERLVRVHLYVDTMLFQNCAIGDGEARLGFVVVGQRFEFQGLSGAQISLKLEDNKAVGSAGLELLDLGIEGGLGKFARFAS